MTTLNYDANGFIVGINRMKDGIDNVHDDTQEIIQILKSQNQISNTRMRELTRAVKSANYRSESQASASASRTRSNLLDRQPRISSSASTDSDNTRNRNRASNRSTVSRNSSSAADRNRNTTNRNSEDAGLNRRSSSTARRERDANGRFISDSNESKRGFGLSGLSGMGRSDVSGVDPLVDSLREAKDLLSPIGRAGKLAGRAAKFSWSKFKSMKRREPLSNDETRHNRENEKLLDKIWKAIRRSGGNGGGGGLLGGLLPFGLGRNRPGGGGGGRILGGAKNLLKKIGGIKGLGIIGTVLGAGSLAMDWGGMDHKEKTKGVGGLAGAGAGAMAGGAAGAAIGSVVPVIGTAIGGVVGALAGAWIGSDAGEALGEVASPHIEKWTDSIIAFNLPQKMGSAWDRGIKPFFNRMKEAANNFYESSLTSISGAVDNAGNFLKGGVDGITSSNAGANGATAANLSKKQLDNQMMVYKAFRSAGLSDAQSRAMTAEIGRENGYQDKYLFGNHVDPANGERNVGMMSWQKDRGNNVYNRLNSKGHIKNGQMQKTQENLNEQARYAVHEMDTMPRYERTKREFRNNPNVSYSKANEVLGNDFIKWRYTDPNYSKHHTYRDQYKAAIDKQLKPLEDTTVVDETKTTIVEKAIAVKDSVMNTIKETVETAVDKAKESVSAPTPSKEKNSAITEVPPANSGNGILGFNISDIKPSAPNIAKESAGTPLLSSQGYAPANLPKSPVLKIPDAIKIKERLDSGGVNKPIMVQSSNDTINQNLSDRGLAHAVTGGFGQDRMWG